MTESDDELMRRAVEGDLTAIALPSLRAIRSQRRSGVHVGHACQRGCNAGDIRSRLPMTCNASGPKPLWAVAHANCSSRDRASTTEAGSNAGLG
jgi:hypothetical protein